MHHLLGQIQQGPQRLPALSSLGTGRRVVAQTERDEDGPQQGDHICLSWQVVAASGLLHSPHRLPDL